MAILTKRKVWRLAPPPNAREPLLSFAECRATRAAIRFLLKRYGSWKALAKAVRMKPDTLRRAGLPRRTMTADTVMRVAKLAGVTVEDVLSGRWPPAGMCAHCGRI